MQREKGEKILVWYVHFPKQIPMPEGGEVMSMPELKEYLQFAQYITKKTEFSSFYCLTPSFWLGRAIWA